MSNNIEILKTWLATATPYPEVIHKPECPFNILNGLLVVSVHRDVIPEIEDGQIIVDHREDVNRNSGKKTYTHFESMYPGAKNGYDPLPPKMEGPVYVCTELNEREIYELKMWEDYCNRINEANDENYETWMNESIGNILQDKYSVQDWDGWICYNDEGEMRSVTEDMAAKIVTEVVKKYAR